jgi:hypothetical protein
MSEKEPLAPELARLFREEPTPAPPALARARVLGRLEGSIPLMATTALPTHAVMKVARGGALGAKAVALATATFVAGGVVGGVAVSTLRSLAAPKVVYVERPSPSASAPAPAPVVAPPSNASEPASLPSAATLRPAPTAAEPSEALAAERLLIDEARAELASGDPNAALVRLQEHARRYPHGRLDEEREALAVQALVQAGRYDAARARAFQLRARWPTSVFLPAVDTTIQSIP